MVGGGMGEVQSSRNFNGGDVPRADFCRSPNAWLWGVRDSFTELELLVLFHNTDMSFIISGLL